MIKVLNIKQDNIKTKIIIKNNYIEKFLFQLSKSNKKIFCLVDSKVKYKLKKFEKKNNFKFFFIKCGEGIKDIKTYNNICNRLLSKNIDRESILVSIGGGTLGDLSGFIASTILRGIDYKLIPTTLLSQVDSSLGGKNGINTKYGKNLIGSFYHPSEVIIDINILKTLSIREIKSGYAEIIKHSIIKDYNFFKWLDRNYKQIYNLETRALETAIFKSIKVKLWYVENDTKEKLMNFKSRAILNFGHTIGHGIENFYKYSKKLNHGEAISIGIAVESLISQKLGYLSIHHLSKIIDHLKKVQLKTYDKCLKSTKIISAILKDKKNLNSEINIILLNSIGASFFGRNIELRKIKNILANI